MAYQLHGPKAYQFQWTPCRQTSLWGTNKPIFGENAHTLKAWQHSNFALAWNAKIIVSPKYSHKENGMCKTAHDCMNLPRIHRLFCWNTQVWLFFKNHNLISEQNMWFVDTDCKNLKWIHDLHQVDGASFGCTQLSTTPNMPLWKQNQKKNSDLWVHSRCCLAGDSFKSNSEAFLCIALTPARFLTDRERFGSILWMMGAHPFPILNDFHSLLVLCKY